MRDILSREDGLTAIPEQGHDYRQRLQAEAESWGGEAERQARTTPPDWRHHRQLRHNVIYHRFDIDALLARIEPGMVTAELGCGSGWLTLAMAQRGAQALGLDISERSLELARRYHESIREDVSGQAEYRVADLNTLELPAERYDVITVKGALHHLIRLDHVIATIHRALKPGGLLWASDTQGDEGLPAVLVAGALALVLPTHVSYRDKVRGLLRHGWNAPSRVRASIQAEGLSPFEGAGRARDWVQLISTRFVIEKRVSAPAVTGYLAHQLSLPDRVAVPLLRAVCVVDRLFVRLRFLRSTGMTLYARKGAGRAS